MLSPRQLAERRAVLRQRSMLAVAFTALEVVQLGQLRPDPTSARRQLATVGLEAFSDRLYPL